MNCDHSLSESSDDVTAQLAQLELAAATESSNSVATNTEFFSSETAALDGNDEEHDIDAVHGDDEQRDIDIDVDELQVFFGQVSVAARSDGHQRPNRIFLSYVS
jgi:hypothetical protein